MKDRWAALPFAWAEIVIEFALLRVFGGAEFAALAAARTALWQGELADDIGLQSIE